ncbi:MAG: hypothetical protein M3Q38_05295 [Chloroflexota bacterium]|nr:hypothetical protein [Chloroflexota bacterium]
MKDSDNPLSFRRVDAEIQQFLPILKEHWQLGFRALVQTTDVDDSDVVPYYRLPSLGGARRHRGYADFRFQDRHMMLISGEHRWIPSRVIDLALFVDAGKVTADRSVGHFSADRFDPAEWKPRVPNPAFIRARPDATFWAARRVIAFTDEMIRAAVRTGRYTDPAAEKHIADTLIARRDAIGRAWLTNVNPIVDPVLDGSGSLEVVNAAVTAGVAKAPAAYEFSWFAFDNATGTSTPIGAPVTSAGEQGTAPAGLPTANGAFVRVQIKAIDGAHPSWTVPVQAFLARNGQGWKLVGLERLADGAARNTGTR